MGDNRLLHTRRSCATACRALREKAIPNGRLSGYYPENKKEKTRLSKQGLL
jgi:hypothetical protein